MPFVYVWNAFVGHGGEKDYLMRVTGHWMCYNFLHVIISLLITICISSCISLHSSTTAESMGSYQGYDTSIFQRCAFHAFAHLFTPHICFQGLTPCSENHFR